MVVYKQNGFQGVVLQTFLRVRSILSDVTPTQADNDTAYHIHMMIMFTEQCTCSEVHVSRIEAGSAADALCGCERRASESQSKRFMSALQA